MPGGAEPGRGVGSALGAEVRPDGFAHTFDYSGFMQVGDLVRIAPRGVSQFRILELDEEGGARIEPTSDAPGSYPFRMRLVDLLAWTD